MALPPARFHDMWLSFCSCEACLGLHRSGCCCDRIPFQLKMSVVQRRLAASLAAVATSESHGLYIDLGTLERWLASSGLSCSKPFLKRCLADPSVDSLRHHDGTDLWGIEAAGRIALFCGLAAGSIDFGSFAADVGAAFEALQEFRRQEQEQHQIVAAASGDCDGGMDIDASSESDGMDVEPDGQIVDAAADEVEGSSVVDSASQVFGETLWSRMLAQFVFVCIMLMISF